MYVITDCVPRSYSFDSIVCVCNSTYCDTIKPATVPSNQSVIMYLSTKEGKRLERSETKFQAQLQDNAGMQKHNLPCNLSSI